MVYFFFKYKYSQSFKQYHPEENISDLSFCFWFNALACAIFMTRTRVYLWIPPRTKTLQLFNYMRWPALSNFGFTKEYIAQAHYMEFSKVQKKSGTAIVITQQIELSLCPRECRSFGEEDKDVFQGQWGSLDVGGSQVQGSLDLRILGPENPWT